MAAPLGSRLRGSRPRLPDVAGQPGGRPVLLATLDVPFDRDAVTFAVDSAVELGQRLVIANFAERAPLPPSTMLGYDDLPHTPEMADALAAPARLARELGVEVTRLRVKSFHPIAAMLEVAAEQGAGIFVFGPDRSRVPRLRYRRAARAIRSGITSLVWLAP
jgi:nucleotide-binding universal stress UspA family protein